MSSSDIVNPSEPLGIYLSPQSIELLRRIAIDRSNSPQQVLNEAIQTEWLVHQAHQRGGKVLIENTDGSIQRVRFPGKY